MPSRVEPMLATTGDIPSDAGRWGLEIKWDGVRVITYVSGDAVRATGRRGNEIADRYPEVAALVDMLPGHQAVLDGEMVAFDSDGRPSFERLQRRMHVAHPPQRLIRDVPVRYVVFDLLYLDGNATFDLPYRDRRELLDGLELAHGPIEAPSYLNGGDVAQLSELLDFTVEQKLEGVVAKRLDSPYRPGQRVGYWRKIKNFRTRDVVIGGWKPGKGRRAGGVGALLLGVYDDRGLRFTGHVGTGFTDRMLDDLAGLLAPLERATSPYADEVPREYARDARWVEPRLTGEVSYTMWTQDGRMRNPAWRGLRSDIGPEDVRWDAES
jgi:bifunctional non-homologous end joining protein LigD